MMRRRDLVAIMAAVVLVRPYGVTAQDQPKKYLVGSLNTGGAIPDNSPYGAALIRGLAQHGYELDKNLAVLRRGADLHLDRLPQLVDEMVASHVDVIVCFGYATALAAKQGSALPVVSFSAGDPIGTGLVDSLAHPGGHITGISDVSAEVTPKRLQYLEDLKPDLHKVAVLYNAADPGMTLRYRAA